MVTTNQMNAMILRFDLIIYLLIISNCFIFFFFFFSKSEKRWHKFTNGASLNWKSLSCILPGDNGLVSHCEE